TRITDMAHQAVQRETGVREELRTNREETGKAVSHLGETVRKLGADQSQQQQQFRDKLDEKMKELRQENTQKLEEMRKTVDEKLQTTLERRLTESFKSVSERLEAVQRGLGEMQSLATGVGDLKRVLTNVKTRGGFGEKELQILIEDFLTPEQFKLNYDCGKNHGGERVEFGIRIPGLGTECYLPVDAKYPVEDYNRLLDAYEENEIEVIKKAGKKYENALVTQAKKVSSAYINPPHTTDWAVMFLPSEGLYAEALRRPGLFERLQREFKITLSGPTNLQVILSTFRMGFRQMAFKERADDVWNVLGIVKTEFSKFGADVDRIGTQLNAAINQTEKIQTRKRAMLRALKDVEEIEDGSVPELLGEDPEPESTGSIDDMDAENINEE
ncbi:MAG: DNA recombination protein RmuC, partial [Kordiimonadaceae bacterium]|nr:DNA recombination protein RmuC [Kordiimonadaceae bacterium]